jgi:hypothetical protein
MITLLCLAVVAAILFARAASVRRRVWQTAIGTTAAIGLVIDGWTAIPAVPGPDRLPMLDTYVRDSRVLELPLNDGLSDAGAQYRAVAGGWKTFNGYSGFIPPHYQVLEEALDARADRIFTQLRGYGALTVVVHEPGDSPGGWAPFVQRQADAERLLATDRITVFRFPPATR